MFVDVCVIAMLSFWKEVIHHLFMLLRFHSACWCALLNLVLCIGALLSL